MFVLYEDKWADEEDWMWRYANIGTIDDLLVSGVALENLPKTQSKTGKAFYQTAKAKCFGIPASWLIDIKFDVYFDGTCGWSACNGGANGATGITWSADGKLHLVVNGEEKKVFPWAACENNTAQRFHLYMDSFSGYIWLQPERNFDGDAVDYGSGHWYDVNNGEDFADIYLQSDGAGAFFSNVIIGNIDLEGGEGWQEISCSAERVLKEAETGTLLADVERILKGKTIYFEVRPIPLTNETVSPAFALRHQGKDWYNLLVPPDDPRAGDIYLRHKGATLALSIPAEDVDEDKGIPLVCSDKAYSLRGDTAETVRTLDSKYAASWRVMGVKLPQLMINDVNGNAFICADPNLLAANIDAAGNVFYMVLKNVVDTSYKTIPSYIEIRKNGEVVQTIPLQKWGTQTVGLTPTEPYKDVSSTDFWKRFPSVYFTLMNAFIEDENNWYFMVKFSANDYFAFYHYVNEDGEPAKEWQRALTAQHDDEQHYCDNIFCIQPNKESILHQCRTGECPTDEEHPGKYGDGYEYHEYPDENTDVRIPLDYGFYYNVKKCVDPEYIEYYRDYGKITLFEPNGEKITSILAPYTTRITIGVVEGKYLFSISEPFRPEILGELNTSPIRNSGIYFFVSGNWLALSPSLGGCINERFRVMKNITDWQDRIQEITLE